MQTSSSQLEQIAQGQHRRMCVLLLAHLPAPMLGWLMGWPWALMYLVALHMLLLWATLNPHSTLFGSVMKRAPALATSGKHIWLTIDDGPSGDTLAVLDLLKRHEAKATFFLVASRARQHPELVRAIVDAGHEVGNHSNSHPAAWFWALPPGRMTHEIVDAQNTLTELAGAPPRWFRAVAGHTNPFVQPVLDHLQLQRVAWSARAYDAVDGNAPRVVGKLMKQLDPGAIVLLHEGAAHGHSVAIVEKFLDELQARGYVTELPAS